MLRSAIPGWRPSLSCRHPLRLALLCHRCRLLTHDKHQRTFCFFEQGCGSRAEGQLVAGARADSHNDQVVLAVVDLTKNGVLRRTGAAHGPLNHYTVGIAEPDDLPNDRFGAAQWRNGGAYLPLPGASAGLRERSEKWSAVSDASEACAKAIAISAP
jgi:hypothetical protein